jgi:hypothetical protein
MRNFAVLVSALVAGTITVAQAATPSFIFGAVADPNVYPVLDKYFRSTDFVAIRMIGADQHLSQLLDRAHQVDLADTIGRIQADLDLGCGAGSPGTIWYQPAIAPDDLASSPNNIASAANRIHSSGCSLAGILPSAEFWGATGACQFNLAGSPYQQVDWTAIDRLDIQGEGMLSDSCIGKTGVADYLKLVTTIAGYVRGQNPKIAVYAQLSFRSTPPPTIVQAIEAMTGVVDGFLLAYPLNPNMEHKYSTAQNLEAVLAAFRSTVP